MCELRKAVRCMTNWQCEKEVTVKNKGYRIQCIQGATGEETELLSEDLGNGVTANGRAWHIDDLIARQVANSREIKVF